MSVAALWGTLILGCAYILPASFRSFHTDPDDTAPAITRAFDRTGLGIDEFDPTKRKVRSGWMIMGTGIDRTRERFTVTWERNASDGTVTVYVRHEAQDQDIDNGRSVWSTTYHKRNREQDLLNTIEKELSVQTRPPETEAAS